jgi:hypothetical protein
VFSKNPSLWLGIGIGSLASITFGLIYLIVLHEPGSGFYVFAGLVLLASPLIAGVIAAKKAHEYPGRVFFLSSAITFSFVLVGFIVVYLILPLTNRTSVQLPNFCDGYNGKVDPPANIMHTLPNKQLGILVADNAKYALVAIVDHTHAPFPGTVFLINKSGNKIIKSISFPDDNISAAFDEDTLYLYNDKLGYFINARSGELEKNTLTIDNYGGLSGSDRPMVMTNASSDLWYFETTAVITSWNVDGRVSPRRHLTFNGIAHGCFIDGNTEKITDLG